jgi:glutathione synthase/RimK-type ligase-like ATP-grasp enzyme
MIHQRAGLPIPRTIYYAGSDRQLLRSQVSHLGGFPILIKIPGYSRGIGVIRVDTLPALFSLMDYLTAIGVSPSLSTFVADAVHWRLTVVGDRVVSAYKNVLETDDFRTYASDSPDDYFEMVPPQMEELAVKAVQLLRVQFGGVDLLAHSSGRLYFLEANFPAYFANAQRVAGHDISGAILDCLLGKANRR